MTDRQENKLSMYLSTLSVLNANTAIWTPKVAFAAAVTDFETSVITLQTLSQAQEAESAGATSQKQTLRLALANAALPISGALQGYAAVTGNQELAVNAAVTRTDIVYGRDNAALTVAQTLLTIAQNEVGNLADYGVLPADVIAFSALVNDYAALIQRPRAVIATRAAATGQLATQFTETDAILKKRLDPLSQIFRASEPAFYLAYEAAREIIDLTGPGAASPEAPLVEA